MSMLNGGDTKERVLDVMGKPDYSQSEGAHEAWQYCKNNDHVIVWMESNRVAGVSMGKLTPMPIGNHQHQTSASSQTYSYGGIWGTGFFSHECSGPLRPVRWEDAPNSVKELRSRSLSEVCP